MLTISKMNFAYKTSVFSDLNIELNAGGVYGLLGKNGVGKTTLLKLISGVLFADTGNIKVFGLDSAMRSKELLQEIYLVTDNIVRNNLNAREYAIVYAGFYPRFNLEQFWDILREWEVNVDVKLSSLSEGNFKKFFIAFALSTNCKIILLNEPTNGLDIPSKAIFRRLIAKCVNEDNLIIISSHQVRDLDGVIDKILIVNNGKIIVNSNIGEIEDKILFGIGAKLPEGKAILQSNYEADGVHYATKRDDITQYGTKIDLELFFNAAITNPTAVNQILGANHE